MEQTIKELTHVYFIGIGGIGMSALARWFHHFGYTVAGYDKTASSLTKKLEAEGIPCHYTDDLANIDEEFRKKEKRLVIYTPAIPSKNQELTFFQQNGFEVRKRAEVLGKLSKEYPTAGVAGTHGKTTTSSALGHILKHAGHNATSFIGGITQNYHSNLLLGDQDKPGHQVVCEADEYDRSFHQLRPKFAIVTNVEADHLEIYGDEAGVKEGFKKYLSLLDEDGFAAVHTSCPKEIYPTNSTAELLKYGMQGEDLWIEDFRIIKGQVAYTIRSKKLDGINGLQILCAVPGEHNAENCLAAAAVAYKMGVDPKAIQKALADFEGVERRFNQYHLKNGKVLIDDYAHHPTEIKSYVNTVKAMYPDRKLTIAFQPHLYSRTNDFMQEFADVLSQVDQLWLLPLYPAREEPIDGVDSEHLLARVSLADKQIITEDTLVKNAKSGNFDVLGILGAGPIGELVAKILEEPNTNAPSK